MKNLGREFPACFSEIFFYFANRISRLARRLVIKSKWHGTIQALYDDVYREVAKAAPATRILTLLIAGMIGICRWRW